MLGTSIFLAGGEVEKLTRSLLDNGVKRILYSFFYIEAFGKAEFIDRMQQEYPDVLWFLDSGAYTYANQAHRGKKKLPTPDRYVRDYFDFIATYGSKWCRIAEPDLEETNSGIELPQVDEWRGEMLNRFPTLPIMPVWHGWRKMEAWNSYLEDSRLKHLAIGRVGGVEGFQRRLVLSAQAKGKTVHGFGCTRVNTTLKTVPYDSVDSSVDGSSLVWVRSPGRGVEVLSIASLYERGDWSGYETLSVVQRLEHLTDWVPLKSVVKHKVRKPFCEVVLEGGRTLRVTGDHSLFTMKPDGSLEETKPENLAEGDFVATIRAPVWGGSGIDHLEFQCDRPIGGRWGPNTQEESHWISLDRRFLEFCGLWLADGSYDKTLCIQVSAGNDPECLNLISEIALRWDAEAVLSPNGVDVRIHNASMTRAMKALGMEEGSCSKRLPEWFWNLSLEQASAFLRGYFSGDGSGGRQPYVTTTSRQLWEQLGEAVPAVMGEPVLLSWSENAGKVSGFGGTCAPSGRLTISGAQSVSAFLSRIGFLQSRKEHSSERDEPERGREPFMSMLPIELALRRPRITRADGGVRYLDRMDRVKRSADPSAFDPLVLSKDLIYPKIREIRWLGLEEREVYDLSIPGPEKFVANGVLVHNTSVWAGQQYGILYVFEGRKLHVIKGPNKKLDRTPYFRYFEAIGCVPDKVINDDQDEVRKANIIAWRNVSDYFEEMKVRRDRVMNEYVLTKRTPRERSAAEPAVAESSGETPVRSQPKAREETEARPRPLSRFGVPPVQTRERAKPR